MAERCFTAVSVKRQLKVDGETGCFVVRRGLAQTSRNNNLH
jgi:hypothetical protein